MRGLREKDLVDQGVVVATQAAHRLVANSRSERRAGRDSISSRAGIRRAMSWHGSSRSAAVGGLADRASRRESRKTWPA